MLTRKGMQPCDNPPRRGGPKKKPRREPGEGGGEIMQDAVTSIMIIYAAALAGWLFLRWQDDRLGTDGRFGYSVVAVFTCIWATLSILCEFLR